MVLVEPGTVIGVAYNGLQIGGALALSVTIPAPNRVIARGDDRAYHTFQLPPTEKPTGELRVSKTAMNVIAMLTGVNIFGTSPVRKIGVGTDKAGEEPAVIMWGSRQAIDSDENSLLFGQQIWQTYIFLNALATPAPAAMEDQAVGELTYSVAANDSGVDELGLAFTSLVHGFTKAPYIMVTTVGKYMLDAFIGDNIEDTFTLSQATLHSGSPVEVYVNGVAKTSPGDYTVSGNVVTFGAPPAAAAKIMVEYEYD
ncbi:MAG: hypothetical protein WC391_07990 [Methanoregula sp.]|jgi:hypothetical protein